MAKTIFWLPLNSKLINQLEIEDFLFLIFLKHFKFCIHLRNVWKCLRKMTNRRGSEFQWDVIIYVYLIRHLFNCEENRTWTLNVSVISWFLSCFPVHTTSKYIIMSVCLVLIFIVMVLNRNRLLHMTSLDYFKQQKT